MGGNLYISNTLVETLLNFIDYGNIEVDLIVKEGKCNLPKKIICHLLYYYYYFHIIISINTTTIIMTKMHSTPFKFA